jgi:hypothetical protein
MLARAPRPRNFWQLVPALFALVGIGLLPWTLWLSVALPSNHRAPHWDITWAGFDVMLMAALLGTAVAALRRSRFLVPTAAAGGGLLLADAWFDCLTAGPGGDLGLALGLAFGVELPLAGICFWIALDAERFYEAADRLRGE